MKKPKKSNWQFSTQERLVFAIIIHRYVLCIVAKHTTHVFKKCQEFLAHNPLDAIFSHSRSKLHQQRSSLA